MPRDLLSEVRKTKTGKAKAHLEAFDSDVDEEDQKRTNLKKSHSRKRAKIADLSTTNRRKKLSLLPTMPLDILFEIFGHLSPKDILNVSRVSKIFRETFMTRRATSVWKAARNNIGVPECPSWMSEPAWAALLFGHNCQSCGTSNIQKVDFFLLKRVCLACKQTRLLLHSRAAKRYPGILELVPFTNSWYHEHPSRNRYYWDTDMEEMVVRLSNLSADVEKECPNSQKMLLDFKEEHKQRVTQIQQAAPQWQAWSHEVRLEAIKKRRAEKKWFVDKSEFLG